MDIAITSVFREVLDAYPVEDGNEVERDTRYGHILAVICGELRAAGKTASLVSPKHPSLDLSVNDLERASPMLLATVGKIHFKPEWVTYIDVNSRVHIPAKVGRAAVTRAIREVASGRWLTTEDAPPTKSDEPETGKAWRRTIAAAYWERFPEGHAAEGVAWKEVPGQLGLQRTPSVDTVQRALDLKK